MGNPQIDVETLAPTVLRIVDVGMATHHDVHSVWLRDACSCTTCRRPTTNERLLDSATILLDLTIIAAGIVDDRLVVETSDGHDVRVPTAWLIEHLRAAVRSSEPAIGLELWDSENYTPVSIPRTEIDTDAGLHRFLDEVITAGAVMVTNAGVDDVALRRIADLVGVVQPTNYGETWVIEANVEPVSAVDSERHLVVHTDLPYRTAPPAVQFLLASITDVAGGATTLVDGFAAAERLRNANPAAWTLLTEVEFSYPFVRDDVEIIGRAPLIARHPDGRYHQVRRAPDLVGSPFVDADTTPALFAAMRAWASYLDDPAAEIRLRLGAGDLLAFHNHRILHGRTAFELGAAGRRRLIGCYLDLDDLRSRRAVVARRLG